MRTTDLFTSLAKIDGRRLVPYGATQLCLTLLQSEYRIFLKFNISAAELMREVNWRNYFFQSDALLLYVSSYNIYIEPYATVLASYLTD
jgi:hypothetical protein